jgi:hypothetical protein
LPAVQIITHDLQAPHLLADAIWTNPARICSEDFFWRSYYLGALVLRVGLPPCRPVRAEHLRRGAALWDQ